MRSLGYERAKNVRETTRPMNLSGVEVETDAVRRERVFQPKYGAAIGVGRLLQIGRADGAARRAEVPDRRGTVQEVEFVL